MHISPMDIQRQLFRKAFRGFDADEVRAYLNLVAEEVAALQRSHATLEGEAQMLRNLLDEYRQREQILKNTLLTAQRVSEEIRENARRHGETVVKEAELRADKLVELAQTRAHDLERTILDLKSRRSHLRIELRALMARLSEVLDSEEQVERDDNLHFLKRRGEGQG